jgi:hypothetical protein
MFLWENRENPEIKRYYDLSFAKRPEEELYDLKNDPGQLVNVAGEAEYAAAQAELWGKLKGSLESSGCLRVAGQGEFYDTQEYLGGAPKFPAEEK